jgi:hypothetical protein
MYTLNKIGNIYLSVSYNFRKFNGSNMIRCDMSNGTTQGHVCPYSLI